MFQYVNNDECNHSIQSFSVAPTWEMSNRHEYPTPFNIEVPPGGVKRLPPIRLRTPQGIGGKQGFQLRVKVRKNTDTDAEDYKEIINKPLYRVQVRVYTEYRPIFFNSGNNKADSLIRRLLHNWGFDIQEIYEQQDVIESFKEGEDMPIAVIGVILPSANETSTRALLNSAVSTALSNNVPPIIFKHPDISLSNLSHGCMIIDFVPNDELRLEKDAGPHLLKVRSLKEIGLLENIVQEIKINVKELPGDLVENWIEGTILSLIAADRYSEETVKYLRSIVPAERAKRSGLAVQQTRHSPGKITFIARRMVNLSGWTIETVPIGVNTYHFDNVSLFAGQTYEITSDKWPFLNNNELKSFRVYDHKGRLAIDISM